jgi:hypothetical protein
LDNEDLYPKKEENIQEGQDEEDGGMDVEAKEENPILKGVRVNMPEIH